MDQDFMDDAFMDQFVSGIYNYCDRWCERCPHTAKCFVYYQEQEFMEREVLAGNDPTSDESAMRSVGESLGQTMELLSQMAQEAGVDLNNLPPEPRRRNREHPLFLLGKDWGDRVDAYVKRMHRDLPGVAEELGAQFVREYRDCHDERELHAAGEQADAEIARFKDALEMLGRYRFLIPVKLGRATGGLDDAKSEDDLHDAYGTAKLIHECLGKVIAALWATAEFHRPWLEESVTVGAGAEALRRAIDEALPGHKTFVRPGLDEDAT